MSERWEDEIDEALRGLRADVPEMDARAFATGRARMLAATGAMPHVDAPAAGHGPAVLTLEPNPHRRSPPLRRAAPWLAVAAAVGVVTVGAVALLPGDTNRTGPAVSSAPPTATSTTERPNRPVPPGPGRPGNPLPPMPDKPLNSAGDLAAAVSDVTLRPGQYLYVRTDRRQDAPDGGPAGTELDELWVPHDYNLEWLQRRSTTGRIQGAPEGGHEDKRGPGNEFWGEATSPWAPTPENLAGLPRDPAALYELVRAEVNAPLPEGTGTSRTAADEACDRLVGLMAWYPRAPADLRAALFRTLGYLPGVTITNNVTMPDGRAAVGIGWDIDDGSYRTEFLVDPATGRVIGHRNVAVKEFNGFKPNQAFTFSATTESVVGGIDQRPAG